MYYGGRIGVKTFKEPLENQAALVYNLIRKVYRMQYPIALSRMFLEWHPTFSRRDAIYLRLGTLGFVSLCLVVLGCVVLSYVTLG